MSNSNAAPAAPKSRSHMAGKGLYFVVGHPRPAVALPTATFVRHHPDGSPMAALSTRDTLEACRARWEAAADAALAAKTDSNAAGAQADGDTGNGGETPPPPPPPDPDLTLPHPRPVPWNNPGDPGSGAPAADATTADAAAAEKGIKTPASSKRGR